MLHLIVHSDKGYNVWVDDVHFVPLNAAGAHKYVPLIVRFLALLSYEELRRVYIHEPTKPGSAPLSETP